MGKKKRKKQYYQSIQQSQNKQQEKQRWLVWFRRISIGFAFVPFLLLVSPFLKPGIFSGHDIGAHVLYAELFAKALAQGQFPVRIIDWFTPGFNQPLFNYYQSGFYYLQMLPHILGFDLLSSMSMMLVILWFLSALFMFLFVSNLTNRTYETNKTNGTIAGLVAALLYTFAPYHIGDVFVRGALPEFAGLAFVPGIFWAVERFLATKTRRPLILIALFTGVTIIAHPPTMFIFALPLLVFAVLFSGYVIARSESSVAISGGLPRFARNDIGRAISVCLAFLLGVGLSAFFLLPAILEQNLIHYEWRNLGYYDFHQHFACFSQLFWSTWDYGTSQPGCTDGMSFQLGLLHWGVVIAGIAYVVKRFLRTRFHLAGAMASRAQPVTSEVNNNVAMKQCNNIILLFLIIFFYGLFMTMGIAKGVWEDVPFLRTLQYPWRFLGVAIFAASVLGGWVLLLLKKEFYRVLLLCILILLVLFMYLPYLQPATYYPRSAFDAPESKGIPAEYSYYPRSMQIISVPSDVPTEEAKFAAGSGKIKLITSTFTKKVWQVEAQSDALFHIYLHYFPGWNITANTRPVKFNYDNEYGFIEAQIPAGMHQVEALYEGTTIQRVGNWISVVSLVGLLCIIFFRKTLFKKVF